MHSRTLSVFMISKRACYIRVFTRIYEHAYISNLLRSSDDKLPNSISALAKIYKIRSEPDTTFFFF